MNKCKTFTLTHTKYTHTNTHVGEKVTMKWNKVDGDDKFIYLSLSQSERDREVCKAVT
jgi:ribosomal protein S1